MGYSVTSFVHYAKCMKDSYRCLESIIKLILNPFPSAQEQNDGKNVILVFEQGIQQMLKSSMQSSNQEDVLILAKAAKIVRE